MVTFCLPISIILIPLILYSFYLHVFKTSMSNWSIFLIISSLLIGILLFVSGKLGFESMLDDIEKKETIIVVLKTLVVIFLVVLNLGLFVFLLLLDVLATLLTPKIFPVLNFLYQFVFEEISKNWYWNSHDGRHILMACIILLGIGLISIYLSPLKTKKKFIHYSETSTASGKSTIKK